MLNPTSRMSLTAGSRLGPYEIVAPLGAGGMGEVYRARDTRLDRTVAVKVLPAHLASDPEFRARLDREAHAIGALGHPNGGEWLLDLFAEKIDTYPPIRVLCHVLAAVAGSPSVFSPRSLPS